MKIKIMERCVGVPEWVILNKEYDVVVYGGRKYITEPSVGIYADLDRLMALCGSDIAIIQPSKEEVMGG